MIIVKFDNELKKNHKKYLWDKYSEGLVHILINIADMSSPGTYRNKYSVDEFFHEDYSVV